MMSALREGGASEEEIETTMKRIAVEFKVLAAKGVKGATTADK